MVPGEDLRCAVQHEVGAELERTEQDRAEHRVVDDDDRAGPAWACGDRDVQIGNVSIGFEHGSNHTRSAPVARPSGRTPRPRAPTGASSPDQADGAVVAAAGDRHGRPGASGASAARSSRPTRRRTGARGRLRARRSPLGFRPDGVRHPLIEERTRHPILVGVESSRAPVRAARALASRVSRSIHRRLLLLATMADFDCVRLRPSKPRGRRGGPARDRRTRVPSSTPEGFIREMLVGQWRVGEFEPAADAVVAEADGVVVGYGALFTPGALAFVDPGHERQGVGSGAGMGRSPRARART